MGGNKTKVKGPREEESNTSIAISNSRATCWLALASHAMESCGLGKKQKKNHRRGLKQHHTDTHTKKKKEEEERIKEKKRESKKRKEEKKRERPMKRYIV